MPRVPLLTLLLLLTGCPQHSTEERIEAAQQQVQQSLRDSNAALQQMAYYLPQGRESFSRISGVGAVKLEQFGERFVDVITRFADARGLAQRAPPSARGDRDRSARRVGSTDDETANLIRELLSIAEIAARRRLSEHTVLGHLERLVTAGEDIDVDYLMPPPNRLARIDAAFERAGWSALRPVRELLGEEYSYEELRLVRLRLRQTRGPDSAGQGR